MKSRLTKMFALCCLTAMLLQGCTTPQTTETGESTMDPTWTITATPEDKTTVPTPTPSSSPTPVDPQTYTLTEDQLYDKLVGGWIGQMVGVAWAAPTEFRYSGKLMPASNMPKWTSDMINNAFSQDDLYVEIPFLDAMKENGIDCDVNKMANKFKTTTFALWHANGMGRQNLKDGIKYPNSGSYLYNYHADDIDWQIECDFLGMMYPGLVDEAAERAFEIGHIMNYGDGVYGGVFVTAMHAKAFTAKSIEEIWKAGVEVIPEGTTFRQLLDDVIASWEAGDTFEQNWQKLEDKWSDTDICPELPGEGNIDAKLNSGYILLGLLYGEGDFEKTILLSTRCGQDSDCNPSSAASILGNYYGASGLDEKFTKSLDKTKTNFVTTSYSFNEVIELNFDLMKQALEKHGAVKDSDESWSITDKMSYNPVEVEIWPDGVFVYVNMKVVGAGVTFYEITPYAKNEHVLGYKVDMGDGTTFNDVTPISYVYEKAGKYTVTVTVTGDKGSTREYTKNVVIRKDAESLSNEIIICSVASPAGGGSKDIKVICDGKIPVAGSPDNMQYDTYILGDPSGNPDKDAYIGYLYRNEKTVSEIVFTEGNHFGNGGWFKNGSLKVQLFIDGKWVDAEYTSDVEYPNGNNSANFGKPFETYTFTLKTPTVCDGIRLFGTAGGSAGFISVGELKVN